MMATQYKECAIPDLLATLKECAKRRDLNKGKKLHMQALEARCHTNKYVANALISMYSKCSSMRHAQDVFDNMVFRDIVSWNILILGYVENGQSLVAMDVLVKIDCKPSSVTFVAALKACKGLLSEKKFDRQVCLEKGMTLHRQAQERGYESDIVVENTLLDMYMKCGSTRCALSVFDKMVSRNAVPWTTLVLGYVENGESSLAMNFFTSMDCVPDRLTFVAALKACIGLFTEKRCDKKICLEKGMAIHKHAKECELDTEIFVAGNLVDMYSKCGCMLDARSVFDSMGYRNVVLWTNLILGFVEDGQNLVALELFTSMDCEPDSVTCMAALRACTGLAAGEGRDRQCILERGMAIHRQVRESGLEEDILVSTNLVEMYSKCGNMCDARAVFDNMVHRNVVCWNILILGYVEEGESLQAMDLFMKMDCEPDSVTFIAILKACGSVVSLAAGQRVHAQICKLGLDISTPLVDFYGKCGNIRAAMYVFVNISSPDIVVWNALIAGYTTLGHTYRVFSLVNELYEIGLQMDGITYILVLTACSHAGMMEEAGKYFKYMSKCGITPTVEHYTCMVDMLGRANRSQEVLSTIKSMPCEGDGAVWTSVLRNMSNIEAGKAAFDALVASKDKGAAPYVLMGDMCKKMGIQP